MAHARGVSVLCQPQLRFRRAIGIALLLHLLAIVALASAPGWHEQLHHDAGKKGHECAITLFATGGCDALVTVVLVVAMIFVVTGRPVPRLVWVEKLFLAQRVMEHAPPATA